MGSNAVFEHLVDATAIRRRSEDSIVHLMMRVRNGLLALLLSATAAPAFAQVDLSGSWVPRDSRAGNELNAVDYSGIPINDEARTRALSYTPSQIAMLERQCQGWPPYYLVIGPFGMKIWPEMEMVRGATLSWTIGAWEDRLPTKIWMDGRPHPSRNAPHERGGFTTGRWEGNTLVAYTTHMKAGALRRNGTPSSDQATLTTRFIRHADLLTVLAVIEDPIYLTEPWMLTKNFQLDASPMSPVGPPCTPAFEGVEPDGQVPHFLPEKNPFVDELTESYHVPREATLGGAEMLYPEYRKKMKDNYVRPEKCTQACGGPPR